jgi:hypothetical protein
MIEWLKSILPRIKEYSIKLDKAETLVDKTWVWVGFDKNYTSLHFLRDQRLLISKQGNVQEGTWEFISNDLLHIKGDGFNMLLNHGVLYEGVLIIQKKGVFDQYEVFYDELVIPDGDIVKHIETKITKTIENSKIKSTSGSPFTVYVKGVNLLFPGKPVVGMRIDSLSTFSGKVYNLPNNDGVEIVKNSVKKVFKMAYVKTASGTIDIEIHNNDYHNPKGVGFYKDKISLPSGEFEVEEVVPNNISWQKVFFVDGNLKRVSYSNRIYFQSTLIFFILLIFIYLMSLLTNL